MNLIIKSLLMTFMAITFQNGAYGQISNEDLTPELLQELAIGQQTLLNEIQQNIDELSSNLPTGNAVTMHYCNNKRYDCNPKQCLSYCINIGKRMATKDEVFTHALEGKNSCRYVWMADGAKPESVFAGYPMFNYQGFGCVNTYSTPIMADVRAVSWNSNEKFDCACAQ
ncbi:hypothetical protein MEO40_12425 [Dolichospermum sp. ST_sed1]|nr:hypothetical protein [Dolichospermum sp. ST_sed1]